MAEHDPRDPHADSSAGGSRTDTSSSPDQSRVPVESTVALLDRYRKGDADALDVLYARYLGPLRRWARGRLPRWARDVGDTEDLVQDTLVQALGRLATFEPRGQGALGGYLRQAILNRIVDNVRRRRPTMVPELPGDVAAASPSPLEELIGQQTIERYDAALARLKPEEREAVIGRVELGLSYADLAASLGKNSADAARMTVTRALLKVAQEMGRGTDP